MSLLRAIHRWAGLVLAVVVFAVAASGALLLLRDPYYRASYPALAAPYTPQTVAARASILTAIEQRAAADRDPIRLIKLPREGQNGYLLYFADGTEGFVHPMTGELLDRWHWSERLPALLFELHAHLFAERSGTVVNGIVALAVIFMALTGAVLWWPRRRGAFHLRHAIPAGTASGPMLRSHAAIGVVGALPIVLFMATGGAIVFYDDAAAVMTTLFDRQPPQEPDAHVAPRSARRRPWDDLLRALDGTFADGVSVFYYPGTSGNPRLLFRKRLPGEWHPNGRSYVVIDPYSADVVQAIDARAQGAGTRAMHAVYPIHAAKVGGAWMFLVAAVASLALAWLSLSGAWAWFARRQRGGAPGRALVKGRAVSTL